ncbi:hypothetical protein RSAG8_06972, partial [Rhizoctonia solani AG-8 WAC10335]
MATKSPNAPLGVEEMFQQIMLGLQKSNQEVAELKNECAELRHANASLEKQVRETLASSLATPSRPLLLHTPTAPGSPISRPARSPFLAPSGAPSLYVPSTPSQDIKSLECPGFWAVVPAGGAGTRLWPLSRESYPKFFLDVTLSGRSLIQSTWDRLLPLTSPDRLMVVTGQIHAPTVQVQLPDLDPSNLLAEPSPKESAAAIGLAAAVLARRDPDAVRLGRQINLPGIPNSRLVSQFKEKPDARTAAAYITSGNYRWNAGMFVVKAKVLMALYAEYCPELAQGLEKIADVWEDPVLREKTLAEIWPTLPKIAIDNAVAEPAALTGRVATVPATFGWDDVGDFASLADLLPAEQNQTRILGDGNLVITEQVAGGIVVPASGRLIACLGVDDLVIVDTNDALLITTRARSQEVKKIVQKTKEGGWKQLL